MSDPSRPNLYARLPRDTGTVGMSLLWLTKGPETWPGARVSLAEADLLRAYPTTPPEWVLADLTLDARRDAYWALPEDERRAIADYWARIGAWAYGEPCIDGYEVTPRRRLLGGSRE